LDIVFCFWKPGVVRIFPTEVILMADYRIGQHGTIVAYLSERATQRAAGEVHPKVGSHIAFKTRSDTARYVRAGEAEGFTFEGKEFLWREVFATTNQPFAPAGIPPDVVDAMKKASGK
jgi:hypothetical protein